MLILELPPEIWLQICKEIPMHSLTHVARVSRAFKEIATPFIYRRIELSNIRTAYECCRSLATSSDHLPQHVRTFVIHQVIQWNFSQVNQQYFRYWLIRGISRMTRLVDFRCMMAGSFGKDMSIALQAACASTLRSLAICLPGWDTDDPTLPENNGLEGITIFQYNSMDPQFPNLQSFEFDCEKERSWRIGIYWEFVRNLLRNHCPHLRALYFPNVGPLSEYQALVPRIYIFNALSSLTIMPAVLNSSVAEQMPNIRFLTLYPPATEQVRPTHSIPKDSFLYLEGFSGSYRDVDDILDIARPLLCLQLDGAAFDVDYSDGSYLGLGRQSIPAWADVFDALKLLPKSTGPVRHLAFFCRSIRVSTLPELGPYIDHLRTLVICIEREPKHVQKLSNLGKRLLSHTPFLHTFLISDEPHFIAHGKRFSYSSNERLQMTTLLRWEKYCPSLRRVSFTAAFMWEKRGTFWVKRRGPRGATWPYYDP